jgi:predicted nucleotidyltransferase
MKKQPVSPARYVQPYRYKSPNIPLRAIRRFAHLIGERFHPEKVILFGSYAYGTPHEESDVDLLVIMPANNPVNQSIRICLAFEREFSLDLIVRTPRQIERGLKEDDWFLREIVERGKVLYEAPNRPMGPKSGGRLGRSSRTGRQSTSASGPGMLPLSTSSGKVRQSVAPKTRRRDTEKP